MTKKEQVIVDGFVSKAAMDFKSALYSPDKENSDVEKAVMFALMDLQLALKEVN